VSNLEAAIEAGRALGKMALYFGCWDRPGHYLHRTDGAKLYVPENVSGLPWSMPLMDTGLLDNGKHPDIYDGKVFWTVGGKAAFWYAFFWWDNSGDRRGNSNSGFYVRGFGWPEAREAFDYACSEFPRIVARQRHPLVLQL
jgi:hypothetical protein